MDRQGTRKKAKYIIREPRPEPAESEIVLDLEFPTDRRDGGKVKRHEECQRQ